MVFGAAFMAGLGPVVAPAVGIEISPALMVVGIGLATIGALLPDVDHPDALIARGWVPFGRKLGPIGRLVGQFLSLPLRLMGIFLRTTMNHRGPTHTLVFMVLVSLLLLPIYAVFVSLVAFLLSLIVSLLPALPDIDAGALLRWQLEHLPGALPFFALSVGIGYLSHLLSDMLNTVPLRPFWPWRRPFFLLPKGLRIRVQSPAELLIRGLMMVVLAALLVFALALPIAEQLEAGRSLTDAVFAPEVRETR